MIRVGLKRIVDLVVDLDEYEDDETTFRARLSKLRATLASFAAPEGDLPASRPI